MGLKERLQNKSVVKAIALEFKIANDLRKARKAAVRRTPDVTHSSIYRQVSVSGGADFHFPTAEELGISSEPLEQEHFKLLEEALDRGDEIVCTLGMGGIPARVADIKDPLGSHTGYQGVGVTIEAALRHASEKMHSNNPTRIALSNRFNPGISDDDRSSFDKRMDDDHTVIIRRFSPEDPVVIKIANQYLIKGSGLQDAMENVPFPEEPEN